MPVSLRASDQTTGGFIDDVDVLFKACTVEEFDYDGKSEGAATGVMLALQILGEADERKQFYSAGRNLVPGEDGVTFEPVEGKKVDGLNQKSKAGLLFKSIEDAGFPEDKITAEVSCFDGMVAHMAARPAPSYGGGVKTKEGATIALVTEIKAFPWEKDKIKKLLASAGSSVPSGKPQLKSAKAPAKGEAESNGVDEKAIGTVMAVLGSKQYKKAGIDRETLGQEVFKQLSGDTDLKKVIKLLNDDEWIGDDERPWNYDADEDTLSNP